MLYPAVAMVGLLAVWLLLRVPTVASDPLFQLVTVGILFGAVVLLLAFVVQALT